MSDVVFADVGRLRQELDSVWKMHDALKRENAALRAKNERLREAEETLSWLELQHVEVRTPALYGSTLAFKSFSLPGFEGEHDSPSDLRAQVRAARKEGK